MNDRQRRGQAIALLEKLCQAVEAVGWKIEVKHVKKKHPCILYTSRRGEAAFATIAAVHTEMLVIMFVLDLRVDFLGDKSRELAVAIQLANEDLPMGGFDTFIDYERVCYRVSNTCRAMEPTVEYLSRLLGFTAKVAAEYEPLFAGLEADTLTMPQFLKNCPAAEAAIIPDNCMTGKASNAFADICKKLEKDGIAFEACEDPLSAVIQMPADEGLMELILQVDAASEVIRLRRRLPLTVNPLRRVDMAAAVNYITSQTDEGCFVYDVSEEAIEYRMTGFYSDGQSAEENFLYMLGRATVNERTYLEPLRQLNDGRITLRNFRNQV